MFGGSQYTHPTLFLTAKRGVSGLYIGKQKKINTTLQKCPMPKREYQFSSSYVQTWRVSLTGEVLVVLCYSCFDAVVCRGCGLCDVLCGMCRGYSIFLVW